MPAKSTISALILFCIVITNFAFGDLEAIDKDKLPRDQAFQAAYADVVRTAYMVETWSPKWRFDTPKKVISSLYKKNLSLVKERAMAALDDEELQLFLGLVANYAYNVDVENSYETAMQAFSKAQSLAPGDFRPAWLAAHLKCQTSKPMEGMREFLAMEAKFPWQQYPSGFWGDYLECATVTNMPAHALRAGDHLSRQPEQNRDNYHLSVQKFLIDGAKQKMKPADASANYEPRQTWSATETGSQVLFTSHIFGLRFGIPGSWRINIGGAAKGFNRVEISTGPHQGKAGELWPTITIIARPPKPEESFEDFVKSMSQGLSVAPATACQLASCSSAEGTREGLYKEDGDGHLIARAFMSDPPDFPGLIFEDPLQVPDLKDGHETKYFVFSGNDWVGRLPGRLYYIVYLDSADSILLDAKKDFDGFLKNLVVE